MHFLLFYDVGEDFVQRRDEFRDEHLALAWQAVERGYLIVGGAFSEPVDRAALLFKTDSPDLVEAFAKADPYVRHGLVTRWYIRRWRTVIGHDAASPLYPKNS